ncbi:MAG: response regulator receiver sensor hybrid histidine kinase [Myxococcales bacterium]|nr:response regulator receiver sensor hybrid histidine kinase [Myxococcales bacterium]
MPMSTSNLPPELRDEEASETDALISYGRDILVVDDNQANLVAVEAALSSLGRKLVFAHSGVEALGKLLEQDFALIILDVAMPGMDGFETAKLVRSRDKNRATPIIFVTGLSWQDDAVIRGYELGAFDFLMKPIRPEVLRAKASVFVQLQERTIELKAKADELREAQARAHERELLAQRRRFESEVMERQMAQLAETDRRKDEFLAILAHELRNPLQPLQTAVEVLEHDPDKPVPPRIRGIVQRQVHHITRLVDDLLDVARFTAGKLELRRALVKLGDIVDESVTACKGAIDARKHTIDVVGGGDAVVVNGDAVRLIQVVCNLLNNAAKYTDPGGKISVRWGSTGGRGFITVTDNGKGIPADVLPRIFDMFVQERVRSSGAGGLGLGLGLVKRLVELHGGTVRADSAGPDRGSMFSLEIPLASEALVESNLPAAATVPAQKKSLRAVVCDDAADLRELVADLLRLRGHDVTVVEDGPSAVKMICLERPDVALIDIGLPDMDGYEVARQIRLAVTDYKPRLIAMTGYGQASDRASAFEAGFDAHITKPASADKILRALYGSPEEA